MKAKLESSSFRFLPCQNFLTLLKLIERNWRSPSPCLTDPNLVTTTYSVSDTIPTEISRFNVTEKRKSLNIFPDETCVLDVGSVAQLRRRSSSVSCGSRLERHTLQENSLLNSPTDEWSETFVAQDGVLTTNFCSTEL